MCGITIAEHAHVASVIWLSLAGLGAAVAFVRVSSVSFAFLTLCVFATIHLWRSAESQSARFSAWLGERIVVAEAQGIVVSEPRLFPGGSSSFELRLSQLRVDNADLAPLFAPGGRDRAATGIWRPDLAAGHSPEDRASSQSGAIRFCRLGGTPEHFRPNRWGAEERHADSAAGAGQSLSVTRAASACLVAAHLTEGAEDATVSDLLVAMVLGDVSSLPQDIEEEFRGTGTFHLFSVSGLHVGMVAFALVYSESLSCL